MDYLIDREIMLCTNPEYSNLYSWCLRECDRTGNTVGRDLVTCSGTDSFRFQVTELKSFNNITITSEGKDLDELNLSDFAKIQTQDYVYPEYHHSRGLHCKLKPVGQTADQEVPPCYQMAGTDRPIETIYLNINQTELQKVSHQCFAGLSYSMDADLLGDVIHPDFMQFNLHLPSDDYTRLLDLIDREGQREVFLTLKNVWGFYTEWRPPMYGAFPEIVHVLTRDHSVIGSDKSIAPHVVGKAGTFDLSVGRKLL